MERIKKIRKSLKRLDQDSGLAGWDIANSHIRYRLLNEVRFSTDTEKDEWSDHTCFPWLTSRLKPKAKAVVIKHIALRCPEMNPADGGLVICLRFYPKFPEINPKDTRYYPDDHYNKRYYIHEVGMCPQCDYK